MATLTNRNSRSYPFVEKAAINVTVRIENNSTYMLA